MATTTIPWGDGSGDNIYLTYSSASGDQTVEVSSDANTGSARTQVVTFTAGIGNITQMLTVSQEAGGPQEYTLTRYLSSYDTENSTYVSLSNETRAYDAINTSNWYANINLVTGSRAETFFYWQFDLSSIPSNATIVSVEVKARAAISTTNTNFVASKSIAVCRGTTIVGNSTAITGTATTYTLDVGTGWTGANILDLKVLYYAKRGTSRTANAYGLWCYGALITVKYTV